MPEQMQVSAACSCCACFSCATPQWACVRYMAMCGCQRAGDSKWRGCRTCNAQHGQVRPLPPRQVRGDVVARQRPDLEACDPMIS